MDRRDFLGTVQALNSFRFLGLENNPSSISDAIGHVLYGLDHWGRVLYSVVGLVASFTELRCRVST